MKRNKRIETDALLIIAALSSLAIALTIIETVLVLLFFRGGQTDMRIFYAIFFFVFLPLLLVTVMHLIEIIKDEL